MFKLDIGIREHKRNAHNFRVVQFLLSTPELMTKWLSAVLMLTELLLSYHSTASFTSFGPQNNISECCHPSNNFTSSIPPNWKSKRYHPTSFIGSGPSNLSEYPKTSTGFTITSPQNCIWRHCRTSRSIDSGPSNRSLCRKTSNGFISCGAPNGLSRCCHSTKLQMKIASLFYRVYCVWPTKLLWVPSNNPQSYWLWPTK